MKNNVLFNTSEKELTNQNVYTIIGAAGHTNKTRVINDYYATNPSATKLLLDECGIEFSNKIWEPACGGGHVADVLKSYGKLVRCSDLVDRGYPNTEILDFFLCSETWDGDIITNPPYGKALEFVEKCLNVITTGHKVAMFLKLTFLEGNKRRLFFDVNPPKLVAVLSKRIECAPNGDFEHYNGGGAIAYAWYVWEKGFTGRPEIIWIN